MLLSPVYHLQTRPSLGPFSFRESLSAQARLDRAIFLCESLGLARPSQEMLNLLERVPFPVPLEDWADA